MRNSEIAAALDELATLYELDGANRYRVLAYREAGRVIRDCPQSVAELAEAGRATELPGVGDTLQEKIRALLAEGAIPAAVKLRDRYPPGLVEVTRIPGVGAKTARRMHDELGIGSLDDLRAAATEQRLRGVKGLGPKLEQRVLAELDRIEASGPSERRLLSDVLEVGEELVAALREDPACAGAALAGSARRWTETCKDVDIVAASERPGDLVAVLERHPLIAELGSGGEGGARGRTHNGIPVDLRVVPAAELGNLLQHLTGSAEHNVQLRERAQRDGLSVSEHGIADTESGTVTRCATETEVYERLGLRYIEPELREGRGEIEAAAEDRLPELVELSQIRGDLHCHTTLSDGLATLEEMVAAARRRRYSYLAITDHSATHGFGNAVSPDALLARVEEIRELDANTPRLKVLAGTEANVMPDGSLDYADEVLAELDWVIASVHTSFQMSARRMTERIVRAVEHPLVDCIGHLTGRLLLRREPYELEVEPILAAAAASGTMIEINSNPRRRDLNEQHARLAAEAGVRIVINTDAHRVETLDNLRYGVATARRAGLGPEAIANTRSWRSFGPLRKRLRASA